MRRTSLLTAAVLACFAGNSLLTRAALGRRLIDPETYTAVRLGAGAVALGIAAAIFRARHAGAAPRPAGPRRRAPVSALALFVYACAFSLAYVRLEAGPGALLLFAAVQITMHGFEMARGTRPRPAQLLGIGLAFAGIAFLSSGAERHVDPASAGLMVLAGAAWGVYSLRARGASDPLGATAANFAWSLPLAALLALSALSRSHATARGVALAAASGAIASGFGYVAWYALVPRLGASRAAVVQLAVPVLTAVAGVILLREPLTSRLVIAAALTLPGIALALGVGPGLLVRRRAPGGSV